MAGNGDGVAHVVQAVKAGDQVIVQAGESFGGGYFEAQPVSHPGLLGELTCMRDRAVVVVKAGHAGVRVSLADDQARGAMAAADVGYPASALQPVVDADERGDPGAQQIRAVSRLEEPSAAFEHVVAVLVPAHAFAGKKRVLDPLEVRRRAEATWNPPRRTRGWTRRRTQRPALG